MSAETEESTWRQGEEYLIELEVTSNGMTGAEWQERFEQNGYRLNRTIEVSDSDHLLELPRFDKSKTNGKTYQLVILKGIAFKGWNLYFNEVMQEGSRREFSPVPPEVACLVLDKWGKEGLRNQGMQGVVAIPDGLTRSLAVYISPGDQGQVNIFDVGMYRADPILSTQGFIFQRT